MSRGIVLSLLQFDFSYSSAIISLSLSASIQLSLSASISKSIKDVIYHKRTPSKARFFPLSLLQKVTSTSEPILFSLQHACTIFVFMKYFTISSKYCSTSNLTSVSITLFVGCLYGEKTSHQSEIPV